MTGKERYLNSRIRRSNPRTKAAEAWIRTESESFGVAAWKHEAEVGASGDKPPTRNKHFEWESKTDQNLISLNCKIHLKQIDYENKGNHEQEVLFSWWNTKFSDMTINLENSYSEFRNVRVNHDKSLIVQRNTFVFTVNLYFTGCSIIDPFRSVTISQTFPFCLNKSLGLQHWTKHYLRE